MTLTELRSALQEILEVEESAAIDWPKAEELCCRARGRLSRQPAPDYTDQFVFVFLDDTDLRREDKDYARIQHERLRIGWRDRKSSRGE